MTEYFEIESPAEENAPTSTTWKVVATLLVAATVVVVSWGMSKDAVPNTSDKTQRIMKNVESHLKRSHPTIVREDQAQPSVTCGSVVSGTVPANDQNYYALVAPDITLGSITLDTCGSPVDSFLYMYSGNQPTASSLIWSCDDCGPCGWQTVQTFSLNLPTSILTGGQTYTIGVGSYGGAPGDYTMRITCSMQCGSVVKGALAPNQRLPVMFPVPPSGIQVITMSTCASNFNTFLYVYSGSTMTYSCDDCGTCSNRASQKFVVGSGTSVPTGTGTNGLVAGSDVRVEVGGSGSAAGNVDLRVTCAQAPTTARPSSAPTTSRPTAAPTLPQPTVAPSPCPSRRVRKSWHDSTTAERNLYLSGYKALRANGKLAIFKDEHIEAGWSLTDGLTYHGNRQFLPWHRYFIWELEEQIRALGGSYACFTLPYWDWTRLAGQPVSSNPMFTQGLGGNGAGGSCVQNGQLRPSEYLTSAGTCLQREFSTNNLMYNTIQSAMLSVEAVQSFSNFVSDLEGWHNNAHMSIGGTLSSIATATDEPMFFMLHAFVDMIWAMRSDCHNYGSQESMNNYPNIADTMSYPVLRGYSWALANTRSFTAGDFLQTDVAPWGYTYHASDMVARSGNAMGVCSWNTLVTTTPPLVKQDSHSRESDNSYEADARKAKRECIRVQRRAVRKGYQRRICRYKEPLEKCPPGKGPLKISLKALLNKRGVRGNPCIERVRRRNYEFAKQLGTLRGLCNGKSDPVC